MESCYRRKVTFHVKMSVTNQINIFKNRCGICGDAWDARPRQHEAPGGVFANGIITRNYLSGEEITVTSHITANHIVTH